MSGQYPPPNPGHPFARAPLHQRPPGQSLLPPWGQPSGMNMVGSSLNFYSSPHMSLPSRDGRAWLPPQNRDPATSNPLFGLQMLMSSDGSQRIPSEFQQEETMDLSSHASVPEVPKVGGTRTENSDTLRNGTVLPAEVNGDMDRTEPEVKDSIVTSVIATNPQRENITESLNCSKVTDNSGVKRSETASLEDFPLMNRDSSVSACVKSISSGDVKMSEHEDVFCTLKSDSPTDKDDFSDSDRLIDSSLHKLVSEIGHGNLQDLDTISKNVKDFNNPLQSVDSTSQIESQSSFHESSSLSIDTNDSKSVVTDTSADDIFGSSPTNESSVPTSQETEIETESTRTTAITETISDKRSEISLPSSTPSEKWPPALPSTVPVMDPVDNSQPHPSVENVEILLESMFNSQEESLCSSQSSASGVPQSVIVSNGSKVPSEIFRPPEDVITPMKEEELAMTLAEDTPVVPEIKEEEKEKKGTVDLMDEIEKKLEMLTQSRSSELSKIDSQEKDLSVIGSLKEEPDNRHIKVEDSENQNTMPVSPVLSNCVAKEEESKVTKEADGLSAQKTESQTSNNPFIEVETELEKMFAGIVETTDEVGSEPQLRQSVSEPKRPVASKKPTAKRKKADSRRHLDTIVFGGSSEDGASTKKKGRKRVSDSGSERASKKLKTDSVDGFKKGKDFGSDSLSGKLKGPFVHIEGSKESPASVIVVNGGMRADDEDGSDKAIIRRKHSTLQRREGLSRRVGPAYSSSTLSMRYNSDTADATWVCVFCKRGPHCAGGLGGEPAGDLFGPYRVPSTPPRDDSYLPGTPADKDVVEEQKKRGGKYAKSLRTSGVAEQFIQRMAKKSKRSSGSGEGWEQQPGLLPVDSGYEVWLHGHCAEWAPGLCLIGSQLVGIESAVWTALTKRCSQCGDTGPGIGCVVRNCTSIVHYHCGLISGWLLDTDTFIARCHAHRTRLRPG